MSRRSDLQALIHTKSRRLQKLRELEALSGPSTEPGVLIQIEDLEVELAALQAELASLPAEPAPDSQLDLDKVIETLRHSLPEDDPTPGRLQETLAGFQYFHQRLFEWKELHNHLNDVLFVLDQFVREVERLDASGQQGNARALSRQWRPVAQKIDLLLDWAAEVRYIDEPYQALDDGSLRGPKWAVELQVGRVRIDELLGRTEFDLLALYDAAYDFSDAAERHMYLADKQLRETAGELYHLSRLVLGSVSV